MSSMEDSSECCNLKLFSLYIVLKFVFFGLKYCSETS